MNERKEAKRERERLKAKKHYKNIRKRSDESDHLFYYFLLLQTVDRVSPIGIQLKVYIQFSQFFLSAAVVISMLSIVLPIEFFSCGAELP